jgi:hypothetical protein
MGFATAVPVSTEIEFAADTTPVEVSPAERNAFPATSETAEDDAEPPGHESPDAEPAGHESSDAEPAGHESPDAEPPDANNPYEQGNSFWA